MDVNLPNFETFSELKKLCRKLIQSPKDIESVKKLNVLIQDSPNSFVKVIQPTVLSTFYPVLRSISENKTSFSLNEKHIIINTFQTLFEKSTIDKLGLFFNMYAFLLFEVYDHIEHKVLPVQEEYKLSIIECTKSLTKSVSSELIFELYTKANAPKLCQMLYASIEIAKNEQLKNLRIAAIECIMCLARIFRDEDFKDIVIRKQVAEVFLFFLPGVASGLKQIALEDEKVGHKIPMVALKAWGRIVTLLMQDYNSSVTILNISEINIRYNSEKEKTTKKKWSNNKEINEHLHNTKLSSQWYKDTDKKLQHLVLEIMKLTHHSHHKVRSELTELCAVILENCLGTMPLTSRHLIEIVIILTEDEDSDISNRNNVILQNLSNQLSSHNLKTLLESLEDGFFNGVNALPRKFNGIDEREQLTSLNLLIGYLKLFGEHKLYQVLVCSSHLSSLLMTIIHISKLEKSTTGLLEEYSLKDLNQNTNSNHPWKKFVYFNGDLVRMKLEKLCSLLGKFDSFRMVSDFLLDIIMDDQGHRKEAIFVLNGVIAGVNSEKVNTDIIKNIIDTYIDTRYWQIPVVSVDGDDCELTLAEVQHNTVQICLLVEGIGKIALILRDHFQQFMLKILYIVLEKAGSSHYLIRSAGLSTLTNVTVACGYSDVTDLITKNIDYFTYHVERKLNRSDDKTNVLSVLSVVLRYSSMDVLQYLAYTIREVLVQSCDKYKEKNTNAFLEVFKMFVKSLKRWLNIEIKEEPFKSRAQKIKEYEDFKVTGADEITDDVDTGKTAEELYEEDRKKGEEFENEENEEPEVDEYIKPDPPLEVKLTVDILIRSLHFLPSKDRLRKLLVLEILSDGLEVIRDWENELLPIVHLIWSPLVHRFKEYNDPLIINYSFQLLVTLARLAKEFIRMRTVKEVLPNILELMETLLKQSYLKDKGSAYRYSQAYKLQIRILDNLAMVVVNLDIDDTNMNKVFNCICLYLSDKQPVPLQDAATRSLKVLAEFDCEMILKQMQSWENSKNSEYEKNFNVLTSYIAELI